MGRDEETEELIKNFRCEYKPAEKKHKYMLNVRYWIFVFHSTLDVGRSMFDVHLSKQRHTVQM